MDTLRSLLGRLDGQSYRAYRDLRGNYRFPRFELRIDHVQGDPFAAPSRLRILLPRDACLAPGVDLAERADEVAFCDFLARRVGRELDGRGRAASGSGGSGAVSVDRCGQEILERSAVVLVAGRVELRLRVGLPAAGRRILGRQAEALLCRGLPSLVERSVLRDAYPAESLLEHLRCAADQRWLRGQLPGRGLVAFVADGAVLPRRSGVSDLPMERESALPFRTPESLRQRFRLPSGREIEGMGVPRGLTLIVGGGYHGKSTLLRALERGIYDHVPGDGRELCVSDPTALKIRSEDGRRVERVDISCFIDRLPMGKDTHSFRTEDASGSTSQAANIVEALELGARVLLLDEDTSATNFLIRDQRMQALVRRDQEPITPLVDRVADLRDVLGCSLVLVLGGSGDYFELADTVILLDTYQPREVTAEARAVAAQLPTQRRSEATPFQGAPAPRRPVPSSIDPRRGRRDVRISAQDLDEIRYGEETIDLAALEQIVQRSQTRCIGDAIHLCATRFMDGRRSLAECLELLEESLREQGLDRLAQEQGEVWREHVAVRGLEVGQAINRLRSLRMEAGGPRQEPASAQSRR